MKNQPTKVEMIPVNRIRIINPRVRDKKRFAEIISNIGSIGLKRPITVRRHGDDDYEVVCGQGRLEAYMALGQTEIPAIVSTYDRKEAMLASLVENIARRRIALSLNVVQRYVQRLLKNVAVKRYLAKRFPEILEELTVVATMETL